MNRLKINNMISYIFQNFFNLKRILKYSEHQLLKNGENNILFGLFYYASFILLYFLWDYKNSNEFNIITSLRLIGGFIASLVIIKEQWNEFLKSYFHLFWHFALIFCLPFTSLLIFFLSNGSLISILNLIISIFFLLILVNWEMFLILLLLGAALAIYFISYYVNPINIFIINFDYSNSNNFLFYQIGFSSFIFLLFIYIKQKQNIGNENIRVNIMLSFCKYIKNQLSSIHYLKDLKHRFINVEKKVEIIDGEKYYVINKKDYEMSLEKSSIAIALTKDILKLTSYFRKIFFQLKYFIIDYRRKSIKSIIENIFSNLYLMQKEKQNIELDLKEDFDIKMNESIIYILILDILDNATNERNASKIKIFTEDNKLLIKDNGTVISKSTLSKIFNNPKNKIEVNIDFLYAKEIIKIFNAEFWYEKEQSYNIFIIRFPKIYNKRISR
ncbi:MAG: hypothetical protein GY830_03030 [Bacteroidetes bacterium]|nr:hypothetical protein [Bacteroidota bacterium]